MQGKKAFIGVALAALFLWASLANLESVPPLWWDEGWTLSVARNWVELGHYGLLLDGQPRPAGLAAAFPVVAHVALGFRLLGMGAWQGRLVGALFMSGALALMFVWADRVYNRRVAWGTLGVALLMPVSDQLQPVLTGRQVLGEAPLMFYLLAGQCLFYLALQGRALRGRAWLIVLAALLWGIALQTKAQVLPFWLASMLLPLALAVYRGWRRPAILIALALAGALGVSAVVAQVPRWLMGERWLNSPPLPGLYGMTALVLGVAVRQTAIEYVLTLGLPTLCGLIAAGARFWRAARPPARSVAVPSEPDQAAQLARLSVWGLAGSWFVWFAALGMAWLRYFFPPVFLGSPFVAALLFDLTGGYAWRATVQAAASLRRRWRERAAWGALLTVLLVGASVPLTLLVSGVVYTLGADAAVFQVAADLDRWAAPSALIETYDSELLFLLRRRYHYPPDVTHVQLSRRLFLSEAVPVDYDPLAADPDYLVVGAFSRQWQLYDAVIQRGAFRLIRTYSGYQVYERVRP